MGCAAAPTVPEGTEVMGSRGPRGPSTTGPGPARVPRPPLLQGPKGGPRDQVPRAHSTEHPEEGLFSGHQASPGGGGGTHLPVQDTGVLGGGDEGRRVGDGGRAWQDGPGAVVQAQGQRVTCRAQVCPSQGPPCGRAPADRLPLASALSAREVTIHMRPVRSCLCPQELPMSSVQTPPPRESWGPPSTSTPAQTP